jgi:hypothetical protein
MTTACRILFISHSHPALQNGGAEIAAFNLYEAFNQAEHSEAWFLACGHTSHDAHLGSCIAQPFSEREYLYASTQFDW